MATDTFPEFTRHHPDGTITTEWMIGHLDPEHAKRVVITRAQLYPVIARPGPAWVWIYSYRADNGPTREHGTSLTDLRRILRRRFPNATITESWKA